MSTGEIFDIKRFAIHDGPGIRTTVFMQGCPLSCWWCHNPEGIGSACEASPSRPRFFASEERRYTGSGVDVSTVLDVMTRDRIFYEESGGGVTFSGGEPLAQPEFLLDLLEACREASLDTALDTSGYAPWELIEAVSDIVDIFLYDIKLVDDSLHRRYTGVSNSLILENLRRLSERGAEIWVRIPLVPGMTDTAGNIGSIIRLLEGCERISRICLLPYNRIGEDKFRRMGMEYLPGPMMRQDTRSIAEIGSRFEGSGFEVSIGG